MQKSNFLELVAKERTRQIVEKGYTAEHDDEHTDGSLADAGACYGATEDIFFKGLFLESVPVFPYEIEYFKKEEHDRKQQLITAAAFINAEYDRIVRAEQKRDRKAKK